MTNTVLVIDDERAMREMLRSILESVRYHVIEAENGVAGVQLFREHKPALVITDILMPDRDGIETVRELRKLDPQAVILAISGGGRAKYTSFLKVAREFGAAEALQKPFRREELLAAVQRLIGPPGDARPQ